jgi:hypothetical protein
VVWIEGHRERLNAAAADEGDGGREREHELHRPRT